MHQGLRCRPFFCLQGGGETGNRSRSWPGPCRYIAERREKVRPRNGRETGLGHARQRCACRAARSDRSRYGIRVRFISHLLPKTGLKYPYIWVLVERKRNILYLLYHLRVGMEPLRARVWCGKDQNITNAVNSHKVNLATF